MSTRHNGKTLSDGNAHQRLKGGHSKAAASPDLASRLLCGVAKRMETGGLEGARVLLLGFPPEHLSSLRESLRSLDVRVAAAAPSVLQLPNVAEMGLAFSHVLVHFDAFDDVERGVDALADFRASAPGMIVVACSALVSGDDLGSERSPICDATLRLPVSTPRLREGLVAATFNHLERGVDQGPSREL